MPSTLLQLERLPDLFTGKPVDNLDVLYEIQDILLGHAEAYYGPRRKQVLRPQILRTDYPCVRNTCDQMGGYAELHVAAAESWEEALYQLAHETIHLLDPQPGNATILEEGIAVAFSLEVASAIGYEGIQLSLPYTEALLNFMRLCGDRPHIVASRIRAEIGNWRDVTPDVIQRHCPDLDAKTAIALSTVFNRESVVTQAPAR